MDLGLQDNVVTVFGAAQGIGAAIARAFARESARLMVVDRDPRVSELADEIGALGCTLDVTDLDAVRAAHAEVAEHLGPCDHVVFAVGAGSGKYGFPFWKLGPADWKRVLDVNLIGAVNVAHVFAPEMAKLGQAGPSGNGRAGTERAAVLSPTPRDAPAPSRSFLFLSSIAGQIGSQTDPPYSAAKAGLINFAQCVAKDLAPFGARANTICPGMVQTAVNRSVYEAWAREQPEAGRPSYDEWAAAKIQNLVPLNRWQRPEDTAELAVFLASRHASNITGQTLNVDGGQVMHW